MHENSEWGREMQRTDSYWRPPAGFYYPGSSPGRNWTPNGRFPPHAYSRYSNQGSNRYPDNRSHGIKWQNFHRDQYQDYNQSFRAGISHPPSMAPGHKRGKGRGRGGSRPFPSKLMVNPGAAAASSTTVSSTHATDTKPSATSSSSSTRHNASTLSSSTSSSSHQSFSTRPDHKGSRSSPSFKNGKPLQDVKCHSANVPSTPPKSSSFSLSRDSPSSVSSFASSTITSSSEPPKSMLNIAQSYSVSVSSTNVQKMKFCKKNIPIDSDPVPESTLAYCESIPFLREILHKKPVVVLERLTEKLIRRKLKNGGLRLHGNWHKLLINNNFKQKQVHVKGHDRQKIADKHQKKKSLKLILSMNSKGLLDKKSHKDKTDSSKHKDIKDESPNSENILETKDTKTNTSLLVDPKVMSLSRPLQTAYSNNSSLTNMPFKNSGRGKNPSKSFHPKPSGPVPRHMQIFDLDKLRTKLKGANFGGSSRKPRPILNIQQDMNNAEIIKASLDIPKTGKVISADFTTSPADSTKFDSKELSRHAPVTAKISCDADTKVVQPHTVENDPIVEESRVVCGEDVSDNAAADESIPSIFVLKESVENITSSCDSVTECDLYPEEKSDSLKQNESNKCFGPSEKNTSTDKHERNKQCDTNSDVEDKDQIIGSQSVVLPEVDNNSEKRTVVKEDVFPESISSPSEDSPDSQGLEKVSEIAEETNHADVSAAGNSRDIQSMEGLSSLNKEERLDEYNDCTVIDDSKKQNNVTDKELDNEPVGKDADFKQCKSVSETRTEVHSEIKDIDQLHNDVGENSGSTDNQKCTETEKKEGVCVEANTEAKGDTGDHNTGTVHGRNVSDEHSENSIHVQGQQEMAITTIFYPEDDIVSTSEALSKNTATAEGHSIANNSDDLREPNEVVDLSNGTLTSEHPSCREDLDNQSVHTEVKSPSSLHELCQGILNQHSKEVETFKSNSENATTDSVLAAEAADNQKEISDCEEVVSDRQRNDESNSQCLMDMASDKSSEALDLSSAKTDDLSPMCIITHVESGAHIYFSETDTDLKLNSQSIKQEEPCENQIGAQNNSSSSSQSQTVDKNTSNDRNSLETPCSTQPGQNNIAITQEVLTTSQPQVGNGLTGFSLPSTKPNLSTTAGIPGLYSPSVTTQYPLLLTPSVPVYPVPLNVHSVIQPVLVTSPLKNTPRLQTSMVNTGSKSAKRELKLSPKPRRIKPKGTESIQVVMTPGQISPGPLFPMFLPTVPSAYPIDDHSDADNETSSENLQNASLADTKMSEKNVESCKTSDSPDDSSVASHRDQSNQSEKGSSSEGTIERDSPERFSGTVVSSCVAVQQAPKHLYTRELTRMESDLDVMHYDDEEPPVLSRINNTEMSTEDEAAQLPDIQYYDGSFITVSAASDTGSQQSVYLTQSVSDVTQSCDQQSSETVSQNQKYLVVFSGSEAEHEGNAFQENDIDKVVVKIEPGTEERIEVGRLNLRRAHGEASDDSDATLIYSCDEDNTCFEEIFQEPVSQSWPRSAPWTENEDSENPSLYEGKLVIVSDIADDGEADGESTSDTNISNERLSLIITTLRKDLEEKKSDRRQAGKTQEEVGEISTHGEEKMSNTKGKKRKVVKSRKRAPKVSVFSEETKDSAFVPKKPYKKRSRTNLIVTIRRKNAEKDASVPFIPEQVIESEMDKDGVKDTGTGIAKKSNKKVTKTKRRIKRRLTVKRRKKKVMPQPRLETVSVENVAEEDKDNCEKIPKMSKIRVKKSSLVSKLKGRKKKPLPDLKTEEHLPEEKAENMTNSDDSDELPTILPPKRRRLQNNGNPLMMMQNSVGSKGNSSERIMREFPRHNWLEQKINQLQQQTSCSPSCEEDLTTQSPLQQSPPDLCPDSLEKRNLGSAEENSIANPVSSKPSSPTKVSEETAGNVPEQDKGAAEVSDSKRDLPTEGSSEKDSFSLHEALQLVGAEDSEGQLVIDEGDEDENEDDSVVQTSSAEDLSAPRDKDEKVEEDAAKTTTQQLSSGQDPILPSPHGDTQAPSGEDSEKSDVKADTASKNSETGLPLDLCVRKSDKPCGGNARPKAPPVQMVLPQIQQPARPASTDTTLVKETKDIVQNVVVTSPENSNNPPAFNEISQSSVNEALNLSKVTSGQRQCVSDDFAEMVKGVVMPVVTQAEPDAEQQNQSSTVQVSHSNIEAVATTPSTQSSSQAQTHYSGHDATTTSTTFQTSPGSASQSIPGIPSEPPIASCQTVPSGMPNPVPAARPNESPMMKASVQVPATIPTPAGSQNQVPSFPRSSHAQRSMEDNVLDKEFEKHLKEFKQLEMLAARKEREREALLHLKKRKAMLLKEMKYMKNQQSSDAENLHGPPPAHNGNQYGPQSHFPNTQHRARVAELRPFQNVRHQTPHISTYTPPSRLSQTYASPSNNGNAGPLSLDASSQRKRPISSEDRRPIVQMINLAMLQRGRKQRRLTDDQHRSGGFGMSSSGTVPTPAHQNKTEVVLNHDADVPSSEITQSPYVRRKTPILEPPGSVSRSTPTSAALIPAHSQQPFQTAGSLIVPARNGADETVPSSFPSATPHPAGNTVSSASHLQSFPQPNPATNVHRTSVNEIHGDTNSKSRNSSESAFNVLHVSQDQPVPFLSPGEGNAGNTNTTPYTIEHFANVQQQWSQRMPNPGSQSARLPLQQNYHGNQSVRQSVAHSIHRPLHPLSMRPERNLDVIDLTKDQDTSKTEMIRHIPGTQLGVGGEPDAETETSVQRELTAALARRQGMTGFEQQQQQQQQQIPQPPQQHPQMLRRNQDMPNTSHYNPKTYPSHTPLSPQGMTQVQHPNQMYPPQGPPQAGNPMALPTDPSYSMQNRQPATGNQYRMQEPTSVKSALLSHGSKSMICPPNYPMNTSASASSYPAAQYQQQRNMNKVPQQMLNNNPMVEGYPRMAEKNMMMPGQVPPHQQLAGYNENMTRAGQSMPNQYKAPQQGMNWRPQVPTSVSNVPMSYEKQQQLMMMTRKTQWEQYAQQKHALAQKNASHSMPSGNPVHSMHTAVSSMPQVPGANYAMAPVAQGQDHTSMQQRMHQHNMRMMQRGQNPIAAQMQAKMQSVAAGYPRETGMMIPGQNAAPALIEFQQQESQRRMPQMPMNQPPPRLHQFNGACVVCGNLAMYLCSSCRMVWYCSQTCQNNHWKRHGPECKPVKSGLPGQL